MQYDAQTPEDVVVNLMRKHQEIIPEQVILDLLYEKKKAKKIQLVDRFGKHDSAQIYHGYVPNSELLEVSGGMMSVTECQMINFWYSMTKSSLFIGQILMSKTCIKQGNGMGGL